MISGYEQLFGKPVPKQEVHAPLEPGSHPKIDDSSLLNMEDTKKYWQMQWAVGLGHINIIVATVIMARFIPAPHQGHLKHLKHAHYFYCNYKQAAIKFNTEMPDYSIYK
eukprot:13040709-Ditylum_brightwellii.AAC.1